MNIVVINASPRKRGNTAELCKQVVEGAMDVGADVEYVNLYSYDFKGCMSCFACHLKKNIDNPLCFWRDDLKDILRTCLKADAIVIGSPIYYGSITSYAQAFLERLLFAADTYLLDEDGNRISKIKKDSHDTHMPALIARYGRETSWYWAKTFMPTTAKQKRITALFGMARNKRVILLEILIFDIFSLVLFYIAKDLEAELR